MSQPEAANHVLGSIWSNWMWSEDSKRKFIQEAVTNTGSYTVQEVVVLPLTCHNIPRVIGSGDQHGFLFLCSYSYDQSNYGWEHLLLISSLEKRDKLRDSQL
eukprot:gene25104-10945_t